MPAATRCIHLPSGVQRRFERIYKRLRDEDPVLFAAVNEANWAEVRKLALSKAEVWAQWKRRCEQLARQRRRAKRATS